MPGIFEGIKVLDLTRVIAGPLCTQYLADMGATVYKVEKPGEGDDTRRMGPFLPDDSGNPSNDSALYLAYNRGKHSITIDIASPEGSRLVQDLAAQCDVVVENYKVGTLARYGLDYPTLQARRPDLVYCSVTGFGQSGPQAARAAYDFILQGQAGLMSTCGHPDEVPGGGPMRTAIPIADITTGLNACIAVASALFHRLRTGQGQYIDASMLDSSVALNGHLALGYLMTGDLPQRMGNTNPIASPSEVFRCSDGYLIIAAGNNSQFEALCKVLGCPQLTQYPRFRSNAARVQARRALRRELAPLMLHNSCAHWLVRLEAAGVPCGPINDMADVFDNPQVQHRGIAIRMPHSRGVNVPGLRSPLDFSATPVVHRAAPMLGEHTAQVLQQEMSYTDAELQDLRSKGVV
ncbi:CaiB/BaiF CoA-transferase family protein [Comamonas humi]